MLQEARRGQSYAFSQMRFQFLLCRIAVHQQHLKLSFCRIHHGLSKVKTSFGAQNTDFVIHATLFASC